MHSQQLLAAIVALSLYSSANALPTGAQRRAESQPVQQVQPQKRTVDRPIVPKSLFEPGSGSIPGGVMSTLRERKRRQAETVASSVPAPSTPESIASAIAEQVLAFVPDAISAPVASSTSSSVPVLNLTTSAVGAILLTPNTTASVILPLESSTSIPSPDSPFATSRPANTVPLIARAEDERIEAPTGVVARDAARVPSMLPILNVWRTTTPKSTTTKAKKPKSTNKSNKSKSTKAKSKRDLIAVPATTGGVKGKPSHRRPTDTSDVPAVAAKEKRSPSPAPAPQVMFKSKPCPRKAALRARDAEQKALEAK